MPATRPPLDNRAQLGFGQVRHTRLKPARNQFAYGTYFLMLPMRSIARSGPGALAWNRGAALSFFDADHGDGRSVQAGGALAWLEELLASENIEGADGEIWLHCYPRVMGYTFKPVSFWYCHAADNSLRAIVVEVNNTFGERHCYILDAPTLGAELRARKVFHVSPFCNVEGGYRFRFMITPDRKRSVARIDYDDALGPLVANQRQRRTRTAHTSERAQGAVALSGHDAGRGAAHPLAGGQTVCQTGTVFQQTVAARILCQPLKFLTPTCSP